MVMFNCLIVALMLFGGMGLLSLAGLVIEANHKKSYKSRVKHNSKTNKKAS